MSRFFSYIPGPELYWLFVYGLVRLLAARNATPTPAVDKLLLSLWWALPLIAIPLAFAFFFIPGIPKDWLFLRTNIACLVGLFAVMSKGLGAHGEQGPGVGTAWMVGVGMGVIALVIVNVIVKLVR